MASSVFYRFRSSKEEPSRVTFDGTGISVFELKKEIITLSGLGNGLDFELILLSTDGDKEYDDDTEIVPRSTTVIAKRLRAARPGKGGAARYVSGKPPVNAKNSRRIENHGNRAGQPLGQADFAADLAVTDSQTEAERMEAVLNMGAEQWKRQQKDMAHATPVHRSGGRHRPANVPNYPPPPHYTCHRCEKKGHWLQECPENGNPAFDDMRRVKKTMGIPRSQLKVIEKTPIVTEDGRVEDARPPPGVMVDTDGNWVVAKPDQVAWNKYQEKATKSAAAKEEADRGNEELQQKGLACELDKRLFVEPTKTPCCGKTYCKQCVTDALLDSGLECPNCGKEGVPIDDLEPDTAMAAKVAEYKNSKDAAAAPSKDDARPSEAGADVQANSTGPHKRSPSSEVFVNGTKKSPSPLPPGATESKKRKADSDANARNTKSPKPDDGSKNSTNTNGPSCKPPAKGTNFPDELAFLNQPNFLNPAANPAVNGFMNMATTMGQMAMPMAMWNPMMMPFGPGAGQWNGMPNFNGNGPMMSNPNLGPQGTQAAGRGANGPGPRGNGFYSQGRPSGPAQGGNQNGAYFRQPVNSHRQGRRQVSRPAEFRDI